MNNTYDALALFSGGLDSILAAKVIEEQGLKVKCLHFISPFFGNPEKIENWKKIYNLDIESIDISEQYANILKNFPKYGYGSTLNPCVDCKILMMQNTKKLIEEYQAQCIVSGEVLGQRPMSQRRDTLNVIRRDADIKDILIRPLCALHLEPTKPEIEGKVNRELLYNFSGRGRQQQLQLAEKLGITEIPTPAGGCKLTEKDTSARYWQIIEKHEVNGNNFHLANIGRQFWHANSNTWLVIGRNKDDNAEIENKKNENDYILRVNNFPSPLAIIRPKTNEIIAEKTIQEAGMFLASYAPKAVTFAQENNEKIEVMIMQNNSQSILNIYPERKSLFIEPSWVEAQAKIKEVTKSKIK